VKKELITSGVVEHDKSFIKESSQIETSLPKEALWSA